VGAKLYVIPGSHPSVTAMLMLERKGIAYRRSDLVNVVHRAQLRALGFPGMSVPALKLDGQRIQGSRAIGRALDDVVPDPPLHPRNPAQRAAVEEAERFGDEELQPVPRRVVWWVIQRNRKAAASYLEGARLPLPLPLAARTVGPVAWAAGKLNHATDEAVRADLARLPSLLDHVEALLAEGTIGGAGPNAADFQIATSIRLLLTLEDLRPLLEGRPATEHARRVVPHYPGSVPVVGIPPQWLEPLEQARPAT